MVSQEGQGEEDFAALLAESFGQDNVKEGEILRGTVIAVGRTTRSSMSATRARARSRSRSSGRRTARSG
jgi:hypothetical protein